MTELRKTTQRPLPAAGFPGSGNPGSGLAGSGHKSAFPKAPLGKPSLGKSALPLGKSALPLTAQGRLDAMMAGCPVHALRAKLKDAGLRPTRQRMALGLLLFAKGDRHLTAEKLYEEAQELRVPVSLATVYNGLHVFTESGLLREVAVDGTKVYYDTNVTDHHHFLLEDSNMLIDIPAVRIDRTVVPDLPEGTEIVAIDVVVRLRRKA